MNRAQNSSSPLVLSFTATLALFGCGGDVPVPPAPTDAATVEQQHREFVEAIKPRRPGKPVIVILARNGGTEMTDFLLPHAVWKRSGVADVHAVAPRRGRVSLYPAFEIEVDEDFASFERAYPNGADYVIVPAMSDPADPEITGWLKHQASLGTRIFSVCAGALVLANADLLDGRRFATHWFYRSDILEDHPSAVYVPHQRYVIDGNVASATGITASVPAMLALVEAIAGRERAQTLASELGVRSWTPKHDSTRFGLNASRRWTYIKTKVAFWQHEDWGADVVDGMDDISLALAADAWTRTGRVQVAARASKPVTLRSGIRLLPEGAPKSAPAMPLAAALAPVDQLDRTLCEIKQRFGERSQEIVLMELEYPGSASACASG